MSNLDISLMVGQYDRTQPFFSGDVSIPGINLKVFPPPSQGAACYKPVYEMFDVVEMSLSWYVMARCRGEPLIALPIFPLRMFIHPYIYCRTNSGIEKPNDLKEKKVGMEQYRFTVGLWARGILEEHHGVRPSEIHWVTSDEEGAGYHFPQDIKVQLQDQPVESLLLSGDLDGLIAANVPQSYRAGDSRIRRVFSECRLAVRKYFEETRIFPITHTIVVKESLAQRYPWIVDRLLDAFDEADRLCRQSYQYPKRFSFPTTVLFMEEEEQIYGKNPWTHRIEPNRHILEKFIEYAERQGYISFRPSVDKLFLTTGKSCGAERLTRIL